MEIRRVQAGEAAEWKALRLKALADAPYAFGTSLAEAEQWPMDRWEERARRLASGERDVMFVAVEGQRWWGLAGGFVSPDRPGAITLINMWVDPERRRSGLGLSLVESVVRWARARGAREVQLWVAEGNTAARALYRRAGFVDTGEVQPHPSNEALERAGMRLLLR